MSNSDYHPAWLAQMHRTVLGNQVTHPNRVCFQWNTFGTRPALWNAKSWIKRPRKNTKKETDNETESDRNPAFGGWNFAGAEWWAGL
jgi:hypothetical protein